MSKAEIIEEMEVITDGETKDNIFADLFNYFSTDELEEFLEFMKTERGF